MVIGDSRVTARPADSHERRDPPDPRLTRPRLIRAFELNSSQCTLQKIPLALTIFELTLTGPLRETPILLHSITSNLTVCHETTPPARVFCTTEQMKNWTRVCVRSGLTRTWPLSGLSACGRQTRPASIS